MSGYFSASGSWITGSQKAFNARYNLDSIETRLKLAKHSINSGTSTAREEIQKALRDYPYLITDRSNHPLLELIDYYAREVLK